MIVDRKCELSGQIGSDSLFELSRLTAGQEADLINGWHWLCLSVGAPLVVHREGMVSTYSISVDGSPGSLAAGRWLQCQGQSRQPPAPVTIGVDDCDVPQVIARYRPAVAQEKARRPTSSI
jgi:hypothetical protein